MRKKTQKPSQRLKKECDALWGEIIKKRAGYRSEVSNKKGRQIGGDYILHPHHIAKKPNNRLRYEISNGICLTAGEHNFGIHGSQEEKYRDLIKRVRGNDIYERLSLLRNGKSDDLRMVKIYLEQELEKLK